MQRVALSIAFMLHFIQPRWAFKCELCGLYNGVCNAPSGLMSAWQNDGSLGRLQDDTSPPAAEPS